MNTSGKDGGDSSESALLLPPSSSTDVSDDRHASSVSTASSSNSHPSSSSGPSPFTSDEHHEQHTISKYSRFRGTEQPLNALVAMREVLDTISQNNVNGPRLFRLDSEFGLLLGKGTQFRVTGPSEEFQTRLDRAQQALSTSDQKRLGEAIRSLSSSVVKRARWVPDSTNRRLREEAHGGEISRQNLTRELHSQLRSAKVEIERLRNKSYLQHENIVKLRGWGLCLDTFEATTSLNTRIPLLILERATCDLGDFLASSNYKHTPFKALLKICSDIGNGLGGLHAGNMSHGDMKPENVLLFAEGSPDQGETTWTAKLCDFGNAESKSAHVPSVTKGKGRADENSNINHSQEHEKLFEYFGTPGWTPPEALPDQKPGLIDFDSLKRCDVFVYGLIVWRVFEQPRVRGEFHIQTRQRKSRVRPINQERSIDYLPPRDRAYGDAAKAIRKAVETRVNPSRMLIPSRPDMYRILRVLRAALQPVPRLRDPRPWKFFDATYYPSIRAVDETPGQELEESQLSEYIRHTFIDRISTFSMRMSKRKDLVISSTYNNFEMAMKYAWWIFPGFVRKSQRTLVFESLFARSASYLPLGPDPNNIASLDHSTSSCYDLEAFQNGFLNLCEGIDPGSHSWRIRHELYSYARLRSKFKLCCWQISSGRRQPEVAIQPSLWQKRYYGGWKRELRMWPTRSVTTIAWLFRGEIGEHELRMMEDSSEPILLLWSLISDVDISMDVRSLLFHLLVEKGCYLGRQASDSSALPDLREGDTVFTRYLYSSVYAWPRITQNYGLIVNACAAVIQSAPQFRSPGKRSAGDVEAVRRQFFYTGESPDRANAELDASNATSMENLQMTTLLHEAVRAYCYPAVEYFVQTSAIPLIVRDHSGQTPIDLALAMKNVSSTTWQRAHINAIIGLFDKTSSSKTAETELPLGWEMIELGGGVSAYLESTVNPQYPSLTFERPKFSLLQERQISLGSRNSSAGVLSYDFDLVRFIHKPELDQSKRARIIFDDDCYKADTKIIEDDLYRADTKMVEGSLDEPSPVQRQGQLKRVNAMRIPRDEMRPLAEPDEYTSLLNGNSSYRRRSTLADMFLNPRHTPGMEAANIWIRMPAYVLNATKVVLLRNYVNILLVFIPPTIIFREVGYSASKAPTLLTLGYFGAIPIIEMWEVTTAELLQYFRSFRLQVIYQTIFSIIPSCTVELCVGISAILYGDIDMVQQFIIGSVICNQLLITGGCFLAGGIYNSRTGTGMGIEQDFNTTAQGLISTLAFTASAISAILYLFSWTQSIPTSSREIEAIWLSRGAAAITLVIFGIWVWFRYQSHTNLFDTDFRDGYEDEDEDAFEPLLSPFANLVVAAICLIMLTQQTQSIVQALEDLTPGNSNVLAFVGIPILLRLGKHIKAAQFAVQDKLDDTLALTTGFAVTICLFYAPLMVVLSWILGQALLLRFDLYGTVIYVLSSMILVYTVGNGRTNWLEGVELIIVYIGLATAGCFWIRASQV